MPQALDPKPDSSQGQRCSGEASAPSQGLGLGGGVGVRVCLLPENQVVQDVAPSRHAFDPLAYEGFLYDVAGKEIYAWSLRGMHNFTRFVLAKESRLHAAHFPNAGSQVGCQWARLRKDTSDERGREGLTEGQSNPTSCDCQTCRVSACRFPGTKHTVQVWTTTLQRGLIRA